MLEDAVDLQQIRRALVIKLRHHGDVLLASPVFSVLRNHAPHLEVDALVYADTAEMLSGHPAIREVFGVDRRWKQLGALARIRVEWDLLSRLRERRHDLVIHLTDHPRGAWIRRFTGARFGVAPHYRDKDRFWLSSFTHLYPMPRGRPRHVVETNLDALRRIGVYPGEEERRLVLVPGAGAEAAVERLLAEHGIGPKRFIHLHPASRWKFKCWTADKTAQLIDRLQERGETIVVTAAPDPGEADLVRGILAGVAKPVVDLSGTLTLKQLAALTARAKLFIGVDSAPMHIAAAMQTPVLALFGPSGEQEWGPWRVPSRVITSEHSCRPCGLDGCGGGKVSECLTTLEVERVLAAAGNLLAAIP
ncbi:MAG: putative lipopolysaccharide heptosyltransferase III [Betaproteobacteria bacterium]|nr:putative lipopolysaccharide heptosyltransferase III [Betaproteobacteria bacterium]